MALATALSVLVALTAVALALTLKLPELLNEALPVAELPPLSDCKTPSANALAVAAGPPRPEANALTFILNVPELVKLAGVWEPCGLWNDSGPFSVSVSFSPITFCTTPGSLANAKAMVPTALAEAERLIVPLLVNETVLVAPPLALWKKAESIMAKAEAVFVPIAVATAPKLMVPELVMVAVALICAPWLAVANWEMPALIVAEA